MLLVIDMQDFFGTSKKVIEPVLAHIEAARKNQEPVVFVEYESCGRTNERLLAAADGYENQHVVEKRHDDGGKEIVEYLAQYELEPEEIKVCGVNTNACVIGTVGGILRNSNFKIKVLSDACANGYEEGHQMALRRMRDFHNTIVV